MYFAVVLYSVFGLIIGSFLNVLILRWKTGKTLSGRSGCLSCGASLSVKELIPVISWILQGRRCKQCGSRISLQYPFVEINTALLFALIGLAALPLASLTVALLIVCILVAIFVYDMRHTIIPDPWVFSFAGLALVFTFLAHDFSISATVLHGIGGVVLSAPLAALWFFSKGTWMGLGDAKLALGIGFLLALESGFIAVMLAFVLGAFIGISVIFLSSSLWGKFLPNSTKGFTMKSEIPFGPFLVCTTLIVWLLELHHIPVELPIFFIGV